MKMERKHKHPGLLIYSNQSPYYANTSLGKAQYKQFKERDSQKRKKKYFVEFKNPELFIQNSLVILHFALCSEADIKYIL